MYHAIKFALRLREHADDVCFSYVDASYPPVLIDTHWFGDHENYLVCRLTYAPGYFYEWTMTMEGQILTNQPVQFSTCGPKGRREKIMSCVPSNDPLSWIPYAIKRLHSTRGITGWAIRRYLSEPLVMAKLAGFPIHNIMDDAK